MTIKSTGESKDWDVLIQTLGEDHDIEYEIKIKSSSVPKTFWKSHLIVKLITDLIEESDVSGWMKNQDEMQPAQFYAAIANALMRKNYWEDDIRPDHMTPRQWLDELIKWLDENGLLDKQFPKSSEDSDAG